MTPAPDPGQSPITRRRFVAGSLVTGAAAALPGAAEAKAKHDPKHTPARPGHTPAKPRSTVHHADVAVVGAGLSGLTAARQIAAAGRSVIVLEARGQVTSDTGPVTVMFDASPASGRPGVLLGFIDGDDARTLSDRSDAARAKAALQSYATYFGEQAAHPRMYFDQVWDKEIYTGGCPVGLMPPGVMVEYGPALRAPAGRIHWAGTETATVWTGYMDGAVRAGKRAAAEALAAL